MSWRGAVTRRRHVRAHVRFYSPTAVRGFQCRRDHGSWRRCSSPLRYWVGHGHHVLRVRASGPTGLRGPAAITHFRVGYPRGVVVVRADRFDRSAQRLALPTSNLITAADRDARCRARLSSAAAGRSRPALRSR
jgi:hypothetical protein